MLHDSSTHHTRATDLITQLRQLDADLLDRPLDNPNPLLERRAALLFKLSVLSRENPAALLDHLPAILKLSETTQFLSSGVRSNRQSLVSEMQMAEQKLRHLQSLRTASDPLIDRLG